MHRIAMVYSDGQTVNYNYNQVGELTSIPGYNER